MRKVWNCVVWIKVYMYMDDTSLFKHMFFVFISNNIAGERMLLFRKIQKTCIYDLICGHRYIYLRRISAYSLYIRWIKRSTTCFNLLMLLNTGYMCTPGTYHIKFSIYLLCSYNVRSYNALATKNARIRALILVLCFVKCARIGRICRVNIQ